MKISHWKNLAGTEIWTRNLSTCDVLTLSSVFFMTKPTFGPLLSRKCLGGSRVNQIFSRACTSWESSRPSAWLTSNRNGARLQSGIVCGSTKKVGPLNFLRKDRHPEIHPILIPHQEWQRRIFTISQSPLLLTWMPHRWDSFDFFYHILPLPGIEPTSVWSHLRVGPW